MEHYCGYMAAANQILKWRLVNWAELLVLEVFFPTLNSNFSFNDNLVILQPRNSGVSWITKLWFMLCTSV